MNREIEKGSEMDDEEMMKAAALLVKQRRDSVEQYEKGGRRDLADKERVKSRCIEAYLPQAASREAIEQAIDAALAETGATSMKDMGKVMKAAQATLAGQERRRPPRQRDSESKTRRIARGSGRQHKA